MYDAPGIGLAAQQIGILKRVIVMDLGSDDENEDTLIELINPEIVSAEGEQLGPEGCLSIPGLTGDVLRAQKVIVKGLDRYGNERIIEGTDLLARCMLHEIDHLNGILYIDLAVKVYRTEQEQQDNEE